jgi:hypothetical protein
MYGLEGVDVFCGLNAHEKFISKIFVNFIGTLIAILFHIGTTSHPESKTSVHLRGAKDF